MTAPTSVPLHLLALQQAAKPSAPADSGDAALRSAIVNVAGYYLRLAQARTPAQMETLIWGKTSVDGADHGPTCAAFASLTLELAAQAVGQHSWVTGGTTYPWPLQQWADVRVDPNPASLSITSMVQDAQAYQRWHPIGDGYQPKPGDWVLFSQHVEVVTSYAGGAVDTIGADSLPNYTVNAHSFAAPLADQGAEGFIDNGHLGTDQPSSAARGTRAVHGTGPRQGVAGSQPTLGTAAGAAHSQDDASGAQGAGQAGLADIPGAVAPTAGLAVGNVPVAGAAPAAGSSTAAGSGSAVSASTSSEANGAAAPAGAHGHGAAPRHPSPGDGAGKGGGGGPNSIANIPGAASTASPPALEPRASSGATAASADPVTASAADPVPAPATAGAPSAHHAAPKAPYRKYSGPDHAQTPGTSTQQAFISQIAPGAVAAQQRYGVPASVTIAQAIDESGWGGSALAAQDHNLFGIKGTGPAGAVSLPTQEYLNGQWVTVNAAFRVYHNIAESVADHAELLATSGYYQRAMADRAVPDAFAHDLTGVYATDPQYGSNLIALMRLYNLYRFDAPAAHQQAPPSNQSAVHPPAQQPPTAQPPPGQSPIPGATAPTATAVPVGQGTAEIPGSAIVPDRTPAPHGTTAPSSTASPGSASVRGDTGAPGSDTVPAITTIPESASIPGSAIVPGTTAISEGGSVPGSDAASDSASVPGTTGIQGSASVSGSAAASGSAVIPGAPQAARTIPGHPSASGGSLSARRSTPAAAASLAGGLFVAGSTKVRRTRPARGGRQATVGARTSVRASPTAPLYLPQFPAAVATAFFASAKAPLARAEPLYRDVAEETGIPWQLLAACDWMQCQADPRYSPVHGEKIGRLNSDGSVYQTKSEALAQCASDLIELAGMVYRIDLAAPGILSVRALADAFAAFRWGGLLKRHRVSAMEFPYSVAGLTSQHTKMHWPAIKERDAPDRPGRRFRGPFGAVPVVLSLHYPATV
jgi:flagellum-specific peptidoglycan hydrolase FlgJ